MVVRLGGGNRGAEECLFLKGVLKLEIEWLQINPKLFITFQRMWWCHWQEWAWKLMEGKEDWSVEESNSFYWFQNVLNAYANFFSLFEPIYLIFQNVQRCKKKVLSAMEELNSKHVIFVCLFVYCIYSVS